MKQGHQIKAALSFMNGLICLTASLLPNVIYAYTSVEMLSLNNQPLLSGTNKGHT